MEESAARTVSMLGLGCFACIIAAALIAPPLWEAPDSTATAQAVASYAEENGDRLLVSIFVYGVGMTLFVGFALGLADILVRAGKAPRRRAALLAVGALLLVGLVYAAFAVGAVNAYRLHPPALSRALYDLTFALLAISGFPTALCMGAYAAAALRGGPLPAWTGWVALLGAGAHVAIAASVIPRSGFLSLEGEVIVAVPATLFGWVLAVSVWLLRAEQIRKA